MGSLATCVPDLKPARLLWLHKKVLKFDKVTWWRWGL